MVLWPREEMGLKFFRIAKSTMITSMKITSCLSMIYLLEAVSFLLAMIRSIQVESLGLLIKKDIRS